NAELATAGQAPWPVVALAVNDISLPQGGLFDVVGFDVNLQQVMGSPWRPPHYDHLYGISVDFSTRACWQVSEARRAWLVAALRAVGRQFGGWNQREPTLHLDVIQRLAQSNFGLAKPLLIAGPSITASAVPLTSSDDPRIASGD